MDKLDLCSCEKILRKNLRKILAERLVSACELEAIVPFPEFHVCVFLSKQWTVEEYINISYVLQLVLMWYFSSIVFKFVILIMEAQMADSEGSLKHINQSRSSCETRKKMKTKARQQWLGPK